MANSYKFKGVALATGSETALLTAATDETIIIKSILVTNNTGNTPTLTLDVLDSSASRARKVERFLSQPFFVAEVFTGSPGKYVSLAESIQGFTMILCKCEILV